MKKLFAAACMMLAIANLLAADYRLIYPNPPGNSGDVHSRTIAQAYTKNTGNAMTVENHSGGQQIIAIDKWKSIPGQAVLGNIASNQVFNVVNIPSLSYSDSDFEHVAIIGLTAPVWYTRADSKYATLKDVDKVLRAGQSIFVAADGSWSEANVQVLRTQHPNCKNVDIVSYRASTEALTHIIGGNNIDLGVTAINPAIIAAAEAGKIRILGWGGRQQHKLGNIVIPTVYSQLKIPQFEGLNIYSIKPGINDAETAKLRADLVAVANSELVQEKMRDLNIVPVVIIGHDAVMKRIEANRDLLRSLK